MALAVLPYEADGAALQLNGTSVDATVEIWSGSTLIHAPFVGVPERITVLINGEQSVRTADRKKCREQARRHAAQGRPERQIGAPPRPHRRSVDGCFVPARNHLVDGGTDVESRRIDPQPEWRGLGDPFIESPNGVAC